MGAEELLLSCCGFADDGEAVRLFLDSPAPQSRKREAGVRTSLFRLLTGGPADAIRRFLATHPAWEALRVPGETSHSPFKPKKKELSMDSQTLIRRQITDRIVAALKAGTPPWRKPWSDWTNAGGPANVVSRRSYTGVNTLLLELVAQERGWSSRWFGTFRQWQELGFRIKARPSHVKPGDWGTKIVFCKPIGRKAVVNRSREDKNGEAEERHRRSFLLRQFTVFSAEQAEGDGVDQYLARPRSNTSFVDFEPAEAVIRATPARIEFGGNRAVYYPQEDFIRLPPKETFAGEKEYYATAFHELSHWTGHDSRLARLKKNARFGGEAYAFEELVAEIGGCFLCTEAGVPQSTDLDNHAAYVASWLDVLQRDASAIFSAASQASAAVDYLLAFSRENQDGGAGELDPEGERQTA